MLRLRQSQKLAVVCIRSRRVSVQVDFCKVLIEITCIHRQTARVSTLIVSHNVNVVCGRVVVAERGCGRALVVARISGRGTFVLEAVTMCTVVHPKP